MAAVDTEAPPDLMSIGRHCHAAGCHQLDFLPFKCGLCQGTFCLEHRMCTEHNCPKGRSNEVSTVICPVCAKAIKLVGEEDPNEAFERHAASGCDPTNYARVNQKKKCPVEGCREKLTSTNTYKCKECAADVCLKHRFPSDHKCPGKRETPASKRVASMARLFGGNGGDSRQGGSGGAAGGGVWSSFAKKAAAKQEQGRQQQRRWEQQEVIDLTGEDEEHEQQQQRRGSAFAPAEPARPGPFAGLYCCPRCTCRFRDPAELVVHLEARHGGGNAHGAGHRVPRPRS